MDESSGDRLKTFLGFLQKRSATSNLERLCQYALLAFCLFHIGDGNSTKIGLAVAAGMLAVRLTP